MKKFEEILKYHPRNLEIYEQLVEKKFIPFVGAGLSAGIGIGSWKELFILIAQKICFEHIGKTEDIDWETGLLSSEPDMKRVNDLYDKIREIENSNEPETELDRIEMICKCLNECVLKNSDSQFSPSIIFSLFVKILNSDCKYSAYSAGEILKLEDDTVYDILKTQVCKNQKKTGHWEVSKDRAVYWLCYIIKYLKIDENIFRFKCVTINFDNIIEDVYRQLFHDKNPIFHLHGSVDSENEKMCVALSDLLGLYPEQLKKSVHKRVLLQQTNLLPYLFLGTSFSEDHIGRLLHEAKSKNNFAIVGVGHDDEKEAILKKGKEFHLNYETILYYEVKNGNHSELVTLLHQLARDKAEVWNNWKLFQELLKYNENRKGEKTEAATRAINWLKKGKDSCKMLYVEVDGRQDSDTFVEGKLLVNHIEKLYFLLQSIRKGRRGHFIEEGRKIPLYKYSILALPLIRLEVGDIATVLEISNIEPLGDSVYIFILSKAEAENGGNMIKKHILKVTENSQMKDVKCKIVIISFSYADEPIITANFTDYANGLGQMVDKLFEGKYQERGHLTRNQICTQWKQIFQKLEKSRTMQLKMLSGKLMDAKLYREDTKDNLEERDKNVKRTSQGQILQRKLSRED